MNNMIIPNNWKVIKTDFDNLTGGNSRYSDVNAVYVIKGHRMVYRRELHSMIGNPEKVKLSVLPQQGLMIIMPASKNEPKSYKARAYSSGTHSTLSPTIELSVSRFIRINKLFVQGVNVMKYPAKVFDGAIFFDSKEGQAVDI